MLPLTLVKAASGSPLLVELKDGDTYNGRLVSADAYMNMNLSHVICTASDGSKFYKMDTAYIRGSAIKYLRLPPNVLDQAKDMAQKENNKENNSSNNMVVDVVEDAAVEAVEGDRVVITVEVAEEEEEDVVAEEAVAAPAVEVGVGVATLGEGAAERLSIQTDS
eukprot:CAMPEP_0172471732 /NCGR_PEP_ID=MMETSP1065-20121228/67970_1 /TAXON_ID=265537 /ORGANISM="Amphiprora paludosa, Strain CCMP125" /LENGTH=163 /DNA_ID=CAMNT_0013229845 /DNA_START=510 /DNA_END=1002 /DNA_ORIENTATION=-